MSKSEQIKRKFPIRMASNGMASNCMASNSMASNDQQWFLVKYDNTNEYSVVRAAQIKISKTDGDKGKVTHKNKSYVVTILKRGSESVVRKKALTYQENGSGFSEFSENETIKAKRSKLTKQSKIIYYFEILYLFI